MSILEELKRLNDALTEGPFHAGPEKPKSYSDHGYRTVASHGPNFLYAERDKLLKPSKGMIDSGALREQHVTNFTSFAELRNLLPQLIETLERERWVSVTERLPVGMATVMAWHPDFEEEFPIAFCADAGQWYEWNNGVPGDKLEVTHWRPLPKAPEEA
jgi:hypothetical protein